MGRAGITYTEVANAAVRIQAESKTPTVDNVRNEIGSGSKSTINKHLRTWKEGYLMDAEALPAPLLSSVKALWARIKDEAQDLIQQERSQFYEMKILNESIQRENQKLHEEIQRLHKMVDHYRVMLDKII